jgi:GNAT superfamily N-acetyltransferase
MTVQLRPIERSDAPRLVVLLGQLGYPTTEADVHERLDHWAGFPWGWLIGAEDDGELVGVAALGVLPGLEVTGKAGRLVALVVDETYHGKGVGQSLVRAVEEQARAVGCLKMEITSSRYRTRAHRFYEQLGYEDICGASARFIKPLTDA